MSNDFILSAPRSGSTWLSNMIGLHPSISTVERRLFGNYADFVSSTKSREDRLRITFDKFTSSITNHYNICKSNDDFFLDELIKLILKLESRIHNNSNIIDKITPYPGTTKVVLRGIDKYFKDAKIILLVRDGRDVLTSGTFNWINKTKNFKKRSSFETQRKKNLVNTSYTNLEKFFQKEEVNEWSNLWIEVLESFKNFKKNHRTIIIKYENLLYNCHSELKKCFDFLNLSNCDLIINKCIADTQFVKMSGGRSRGEMKIDSPTRNGVSGDWVNYFSLHDANLFNSIAGKYLLEYDYENHSDWPSNYNYKY